MPTRSAQRRPHRLRLATAIVGLALLSTACSDTGASPQPKPQPSRTPVSKVSVGLYGHPAEIKVYEELVTEFNADHSDIRLSLTAWRSPAEASAAIRGGADLPDVFVSDYTDFSALLANRSIQPVSNLLDERGISFGDRFNRESLEGFSSDNLLQCMPYQLSPQVLFYNTDLVDLEAAGIKVVEEPTGAETWSFKQFSTVATNASRPRRKINGLAVEPTLAGLGAYLYSAGATLVDDAVEPTTLTFADDSSKDALSEVLPLLREPGVTMSQTRLQKKSALEWFKAGKVAMIAGTRDMVPALREQSGLNWNVVRMPRVAANMTTANLTGLCMSADTKDPDAAADVIAELVDDESLTLLSQQGYAVPANVSVAASEAITQKGLLPANSGAFAQSQKTMQLPVNVPDQVALDTALRPQLEALLVAGPTLDVEAAATAIDTASRSIIAAQRAALDRNPEASQSPSAR